MPDDYYVSKYSGEEIDDAIARALPGGAIDITLQNKAPSGFGYGDTQSIVFWDDEDGTKLEQNLDSKFTPDSMRNKVFRAMLVDFPICKVSGNGGFADILADNSNDSNGYPNNILIVFYAPCNGLLGPSRATKQKINGIWYPWEYVNPPMILGEEYRTTERYLGKPVYVRLHDFGALPNNTFKEDHSPESWSIDKAICAYGTTSAGVTIPTQNYGGQITDGRRISMYFMRTEVTIATDGNFTSISATLFLKYTKTTD